MSESREHAAEKLDKAVERISEHSDDSDLGQWEETSEALRDAADAADEHVKRSKVVNKVNEDFEATGRSDPGRI